MAKFYELNNAKYLYKDQYGKQVFHFAEMPDSIKELDEKIKKYNSLNPIIFEKNIIKFNDTKHVYKPREMYDLLYFVNKTENKKNQKVYINLHISDMIRQKQKAVPMISIENL